MQWWMIYILMNAKHLFYIRYFLVNHTIYWAETITGFYYFFIFLNIFLDSGIDAFTDMLIYNNGVR